MLTVFSVKVFQQQGKPNDILIIQRFPSLDAVKIFLANPKLKEAQAKAGALAPPTVLIGIAP